jgi:hypothetical protein
MLGVKKRFPGMPMKGCSRRIGFEVMTIRIFKGRVSHTCVRVGPEVVRSKGPVIHLFHLVDVFWVKVCYIMKKIDLERFRLCF